MNIRSFAWLVAASVSSFALLPGVARASSTGLTSNQGVTPTANSNLWAWGGNDGGELGKGHTAGAGNMVPASVTNRIVHVSSGGGTVGGTTAAITSDGTLLTWGINGQGQLGNGNTTDNYTPTAMGGGSTIFTNVSVGPNYMVATDYDGKVWAWGGNVTGVLGNGTTTSSSTPVAVTYADGSSLSGFVDVGAGYQFSVGLRGDGTLWAWGQGANGELGNNSTANQLHAVQVSTMTRIKALSVGAGHTLALRSDGTVWGFGDDAVGELGFTGTTAPVAVQIALPLPARAISAGYQDSAVILSDGSVRNWGYNVVGELGNSSTTNSATPITPSLGSVKAVSVSSGLANRFVALSDGTVRSWGYNLEGELGNNSTANSSVPVTPTISGVAEVSGGNFGNFALAPSGLVSAWGYNADGEVGNGATTNTSAPASIAGLTTVKSVATGCFHSLAVLADGTVKAWGYNAYGQLGDSTVTSRTAPVTIPGLSGIVAVGAGCFHSLAVKADGTVYTWGQNTYGQLGNGTTTDGHVPALVTGITRAVAAVGGDGHTLVLLADGTVQAFGSNLQGQLGTTAGSSLSPNPVNLTNVKEIAAGYAHSYALVGDGTVRTWGDNTYGELGVGDTATHGGILAVSGVGNVKSIVSGGANFHTVALTSLGVPMLWGNNAYGQLGNYPTAYSVAVTTPVNMAFASGLTRTVGAGYIDSYIISPTNTLWCVGDNSTGEFGSGSTTPASSNMVAAASVAGVTGVFGGSYFTVAMSH